MEKIVSKIIAMGIPGLILLLSVNATGLFGAAALTTALSTLGGPLGMIGGLTLLGYMVLVSHGISEYGFKVLFSKVIKSLIKNGETKESILFKINSYKISKSLKLILKEELEKNWNDEFNSSEGSIL